MKNEEKLIYELLRINPSYVDIKKILFLNLNWKRFLSISFYHGITNILYYNLKNLQLINYLPKEIISLLEKYYNETHTKNKVLLDEIIYITEKLKNINIDILLFKGIILCNLIYPDIGLREFSDVDILAKEEDFDKIRDILINNNYNEKKQKTSYLFIKMLKGNVACYIELHTKIVPERPYDIQIPYIWQRAKELSLFDKKIKYPSEEDMFIILALHVRRHTRELALKFIFDIFKLLYLYKSKMDWDYIYELAKKNHIKNTIYFCIYITQELFQLDISDEILEKFKPPFLTKKMIYICMNKNNFLDPYIWQGYFLRLFLFDSFFDFFIYLKRRLI